MKLKPLYPVIIIFLLFFNTGAPFASDYEVDICVYGGTSAGVIAAYTAKTLGHTVLLVEPGNHLGRRGRRFRRLHDPVPALRVLHGHRVGGLAHDQEPDRGGDRLLLCHLVGIAVRLAGLDLAARRLAGGGEYLGHGPRGGLRQGLGGHAADRSVRVGHPVRALRGGQTPRVAKVAVGQRSEAG